MKPLTEQALKEAVLTILRYPNGKRPPRNSIAEEIRHEQAEKLVNLILSDRKAYGEYVIGRDVCVCGCNFGDGCLCLSDVKLRAEQRQRNTSGMNK